MQMDSASKEQTEATSEVKTLVAPKPDVEIPKAMSMIDRVAPGWTMVIGAVFSLGIYLFLASLAVFSVFFHSNVVSSGTWIVAPLLVMVGIVPVIGIMLFEYAYSRALAGFRFARGPAAIRVRAVAGMATLFVMTLVHPMSGLACFVAAGLGGVVLLGLARARKFERLWDFVPEEAVTIFSGRDRTGARLAQVKVREHALAGATVMAFTALALLLGYGVASYLTTQSILSGSAVSAIALLNALSAFSILSFVREGMKLPGTDKIQTNRVEGVSVSEEVEDNVGLSVAGLTVTDGEGHAILSDLSFKMPPGSILGVDGSSGSGKSLLLSAMADPFSFEDLQIRGSVRMNGDDLWRRDHENRLVPVVHVTDDPVLLPASGEDNLSCFLDGYFLSQAKRNLEKLVFSKELVGEICAAQDARRLPGMQRKTLTLARAFTMAPNIYLFDRPEDGLPEKQIGAFLARLQEETRFGRSAVLVTQNRALLEACDKTLVLHDGRVIDFGTAEDIRTRKAAGWARFVSDRSLDVEENLENWVRSHFKRPGDEANRRKVALVASEMLALSCQSASGLDQTQTVVFDFKHMVGHCILRLQDGDSPLTTSTLQKAEQESLAPKEGVRLSPLASVLQNCSEIEAGADLDRRVLTVKIETFDPRKTKSKATDEKAGS